MTRPDPAAAATEPVDPPAGVAADAGADELLEPALLQATVSSAAPSATARPAPNRIAAGVRIPTDALIVTVSRLLTIVVIVTTVAAASRLDRISVTPVTRELGWGCQAGQTQAAGDAKGRWGTAGEGRPTTLMG
jgi:hypothetical protein